MNSFLASTTSWAELRHTSAATGTACFWYRGDSEETGDFLRFRLDGTLKFQLSGWHSSWNEFCFAVAAGAHTYRWEYSKDGAVNSVEDRYMIDDVRLPPSIEQCDDGNSTPGDDCDALCRTE